MNHLRAFIDVGFAGLLWLVAPETMRMLPEFFLGLLLALCVLRLLSSLRKKPPGLAGHWGGFGGNNMGWEMSESLALLILTGLLVVAFTVILTFPSKETKAETDPGVETTSSIQRNESTTSTTRKTPAR